MRQPPIDSRRRGGVESRIMTDAQIANFALLIRRECTGLTLPVEVQAIGNRVESVQDGNGVAYMATAATTE